MLLLVFVTIPVKEAKRFARQLLKKRLCACVTITGEVSSYFWWKNKIDSAKEALCIIKTRRSLYADLKKTIESIHPYEVCEIIALSSHFVNRPYRDWCFKETSLPRRKESKTKRSDTAS